MTLRHARALFFLAAASAAAPSHADVITVGSGAGCDFADATLAVAAAADGDEVRFSAETFQSVDLQIADKSVALKGGYVGCAGDPIGGRTLMRESPRLISLLTIRGDADVRIVGIDFQAGIDIDRDGDGPDEGDGGCIDYAGSGTLALRDVRLQTCSADYGGGLSFRATSAGAALTFEDGVEVIESIGRNGGGAGLSVDGPARVEIRGRGRFWRNVTDNYGGAIRLSGPVDFDFGAADSGAGNEPYFFENRASDGAAIASLLTELGAPAVRAYTVDPLRPLRFEGQRGDSVFLLDGQGLPAGSAPICLWNASVVGSPVRSIANLSGSGASLHFNPAADGTICGPPPAGAVLCARGVACNQITRNGLVAGSDRGLFYFFVAPLFEANDVTIAGNYPARHLIRSELNTPLEISMRNTAIVDNTFGQGIIFATGPTPAELDQVTIAGNRFSDAGAAVLHPSSDFVAIAPISLARSIVDQPSASLFFGPVATVDAHHVAATDVRQLPAASPAVLQLSSNAGDGLPVAGYVDAAAGDFRLAGDSVLVDYAPAGDGLARDAAGQPRTRDLAKPNLDGPRDLGAYETQIEAGVLFVDGFE